MRNSVQYTVHLQRKNTERVGRLWIRQCRERLIASFSYDADWLPMPGSFPLSPDLPFDTHPVVREGLFLCLADCLPGEWGQRLLLRREELQAERARSAGGRTGKSGRSARDPGAALTFLRNDATRMGALRFSTDDGAGFTGASEEESCPGLQELEALCRASQHFLAGTADLEEVTLLVRAGASLGGSRPRVSVCAEDGTLYVASLPAPGDGRDRPLWDYVTLELASRAGLRVAECRLEQVAGRNVLLVRRCDRNAAQRIPFLSGRSLLQARGCSDTDLAGMATVLEQEGSRVREDLQEIWNRLVFSVCVHGTNTDPGSWGFVREDFGWRLTPVSSLDPSLPWECACRTGLLHESAFDAAAARFVRMAEMFRLKEQEAQSRLDALRETISQWRDVAGEAGADPEEIERMQLVYGGSGRASLVASPAFESLDAATEADRELSSGETAWEPESSSGAKDSDDSARDSTASEEAQVQDAPAGESAASADAKGEEPLDTLIRESEDHKDTPAGEPAASDEGKTREPQDIQSKEAEASADAPNKDVQSAVTADSKDAPAGDSAASSEAKGKETRKESESADSKDDPARNPAASSGAKDKETQDTLTREAEDSRDAPAGESAASSDVKDPRDIQSRESAASTDAKGKDAQSAVTADSKDVPAREPAASADAKAKETQGKESAASESARARDTLTSATD